MVTHAYAILSLKASANVQLHYISGDWQCSAEERYNTRMREVQYTTWLHATGLTPQYQTTV